MIRPRVNLALQSKLVAALDGVAFGRPCYAFDEVGSTMDVAHDVAAAGAAEGALVWAEQQTDGRGRAGREWVSPLGGIYLSLILRPKRSVAELAQLALIAGLGVAEAVGELAACSPVIRWPNDILIEDRKLAGILCEAKTDKAGGRYAVLGLGLNATTEASDLPDQATSLSRLMHPAPDRLRVAATILAHIDSAYRRWANGGLAAIHADLIRRTGWFGRLIHITTPSDSFQGQAVNLDEAGRLLVRLDSGVVRAVDMGDVTLLR